MSIALFVLHWPDVAAAAGPEKVSPGLVAALARRRLCLLHEDFAGYVWDPHQDAGPPAESEFRRWSLLPLSEDLNPDGLRALVARHPEADAMVLAMDAARAAEALEVLGNREPAVEVWCTSSLFEVLGARSTGSVALMVHRRALEAVLPDDAALEDGEDALLRMAAVAGIVLWARTYGDGESRDMSRRRETAGEPHEDAEQAMRGDFEALLRQPFPPQTLIVAGSALPWLLEAARAARKSGVRLLVWSPDEEAIEPELAAAVDGVMDLADLCAPGLPEAPVAAGEAARSVHPGHPRAEQPIRPDELVRLVYALECVLRREGWNRAPVPWAAAKLAAQGEFGPRPRDAVQWLLRGVQEELLLARERDGRDWPDVVVRLNLGHPLVRGALDVPERCLRLISQMLQKIPWVSFKLLRTVLMREQWLGGAPYHLDEPSVDEWINFLIQDGAIQMTREPNLRNPQFPVTALRLNESHPMVGALAPPEQETARLASERAILAVDHFIRRNRKPWMAMGALRRALSSLGRDELQSVLHGLQSAGALVTESYPNPQKAHATTGCRLNVEEPQVSRALTTRDAIIRVTRYHQSTSTWVPIAQLQDSLAHDDPARPPTGLGPGWILLLRDEGILELDQERLGPGSAWVHANCRLNLEDVVVMDVVQEQGETATP